MKAAVNGEKIDSVFTQRNFTKTTNLERIIGNLPTWALSPFIGPSRDVHSLFLGLMGAEVAWHVALTSLPCQMGTSYLAKLTGY